MYSNFEIVEYSILSTCIYQEMKFSLCEYQILQTFRKILIKSRSLESNQTKIKRWKLQTRFYWVCSWEIMKSLLFRCNKINNDCSSDSTCNFVHYIWTTWPDCSKRRQSSDCSRLIFYLQAGTVHVNVILCSSYKLPHLQVILSRTCTYYREHARSLILF